MLIESSHKELLATYLRRKEEFEHNLDVQIFHRDAEQAEAWISFREGFLGNEDDDLGVGPIKSCVCLFVYLIVVFFFLYFVCLFVHFVYSFCSFVCFILFVFQDSVDTVEEMLKKQEDFEKMLAAQEEKFHLLNRETKVYSCKYIAYPLLFLTDPCTAFEYISCSAKGGGSRPQEA